MGDINYEKLGYDIIGAAYEVRKALGRFLYESTYEEALQIELQLRGIKSERQVYRPVIYKGHQLEKSFKLDLLVENCVVIELKTLPVMGKGELAQITSYLRFCGYPLGYLINFRACDFTATYVTDNQVLDKGIYRIANNRLAE